MDTQVVVIGGGVTGVGVYRDLTMRGINAVLIEKGDLANGTSSGFHGLLHSGGRYALTDPSSARECIDENVIIRRIAPHCVDDIGGVFIQMEGDDPEYVKQWFNACEKTSIKAQELDVQKFLKEEPNVSSKTQRAFHVPDGAVDGFRLIQDNVLSAEQHGGKTFLYTEVIGINISGGKVNGIKVRHRDGQEETITCQYVVNAAGPWAGQMAELAGVKLNVLKNKGSLIIFNHRLTNTSIQRCTPPGNGGALIPHHTVSIFGTTSSNVENPEDNRANYKEVCELLDYGSKMIPSMRDARIIRAFAGVRPLFQPDMIEGEEQARNVTRDFFVIDHESRDGLTGFVSVVGGKFSTFRLMAEKAVDLVASKLGNVSPCRTALESLPGGDNTILDTKSNDLDGQMICECEQVSENVLMKALTDHRNINLNDLRRKTRLGMGTCQGTFCTYRALGLLQKTHQLSSEEIRMLLTDVLTERWKGMSSVLWGQSLKEAEIMRSVYSNILNIEGLEESYAQI